MFILIQDTCLLGCNGTRCRHSEFSRTVPGSCHWPEDQLSGRSLVYVKMFKPWSFKTQVSSCSLTWSKRFMEENRPCRGSNLHHSSPCSRSRRRTSRRRLYTACCGTRTSREPENSQLCIYKRYEISYALQGVALGNKPV